MNKSKGFGEETFIDFICILQCIKYDDAVHNGENESIWNNFI